MSVKKLWGGGFNQTADADLESFWGSISFDYRLAVIDITGSIAHASMLGKTGIIAAEDADKIVSGLKDLLVQAKAGEIEFSQEDEDIHMNIERLLTEKIGPVAGKLHTARSRNDQVATDMHLYVRENSTATSALLMELVKTLIQKAEENIDAVMPGYTHLQRAQPVLFAHHLLAYAWMFLRDVRRVQACAEEANLLPLGSGAIAGTTFPIDRKFVAEQLGFKSVYQNSMDAVSNRDHIIQLLMANSLIAAHLSRLCEEVVLWTSSEFGFVKLSDAYCTGSSMMPQKKNADLAELVRGKTGRVYGHLFAMLTTLKGLPLTYNKDFQEDKEGLFDSVDTVQKSLTHITGMMKTVTAQKETMRRATREGFLNATDLADYLSVKGMPFREAHDVTARLVVYALDKGATLEDITLEEFKSFSPLFEDDLYHAIAIDTVVGRRTSEGGTAPDSVKVQLSAIKQAVAEL
jgi:argininosuccinate lyase